MKQMSKLGAFGAPAGAAGTDVAVAKKLKKGKLPRHLRRGFRPQ